MGNDGTCRHTSGITSQSRNPNKELKNPRNFGDRIIVSDCLTMGAIKGSIEEKSQRRLMLVLTLPCSLMAPMPNVVAR